MQSASRFQREILPNLLWLVASVVVAFLVWVLATTEADPIVEDIFPNIPVQIDVDPGMLIVSTQPRSVTVRVRSQQSIVSLLTPQDITVRADLTGRGTGVYSEELNVTVSRRAVADTQPRQIQVTLEETQSKLVSVQANITQNPPLGFQREEPQFSETEIMVSGPASLVEDVVAVRVSLDLSQQRATLQQDAQLTPIDASGTGVQNVTLEPSIVQVTVPISRREDVAEVSITPNIDTNSLPEGYFVSSLGYDPATIFVSGNLAVIPNTLLTERISLEGQTDDLEVTVPVIVPQGLLLLGEQSVTVSIGISALTITRQFEEVPITIIGLANGLDVQLVTEQVSVLVTGPQAQLEDVTAEDIQVVIDLNGLEAGNYELTPVVTINQLPVDAQSVSVLPASISATILDPTLATPTGQPSSP
jgi:YbbR domain-containing protein